MLYINDAGEIEDKEPAEDDYEARLLMMKDALVKKKTKEQQRDDLIKYMAMLLEIDDPFFDDFLNS